MIPNDKAFNGKSCCEENGKVYYRYRCIEKKGRYLISVRFVSTNSPYKQGLAIKFINTPEFKGKLRINDGHLKVPKKRHFVHVISEGSFPDNEFKLQLRLEDGAIAFGNASNLLDPVTAERFAVLTGKQPNEFEGKGFTSGFYASHMYGNAFWIETLSENHYRFHCNDHIMDDDFDDFVFDMLLEEFLEE